MPDGSGRSGQAEHLKHFFSDRFFTDRDEEKKTKIVQLHFVAFTMRDCVPAHFMDVEQHFRNSIDLDAEQTEARYDQEMLSDIINDNDRGELQKAESCLVDDYKYDHGQKIQRLDPCEICLCIDGEIFCWWKQCDSFSKAADETESQMGSSHQTSKSDQLSSELISEASTAPSARVGIPTAKSQGSFDLKSLNGNDGSNGATRLTLSDSLTDGGTTVVSSTLPISTPSSRAHDSDHASSEVVTHHGSVHTVDTIEGIPKNILTFPQTPPIMMHRPVSTGPITSIPPKYADGNPKPKHGSTVDDQTTEIKKPQYKLICSFGEIIKKSKSSGDRKPTVAIASDALPKVFPADTSREKSSTKSYDQSVEETNNAQNGKSSRDQEHRSNLERQQQFGGYGYGMIHESESERRSATASQRTRDRDVPQHYIITSSGHVEMFDDSGVMGGPENQDTHIPDADGFGKQQYRDVLSFDGRVSSRVVQDQPANGSNDEDSNDTDSEEEDTEEDTGEQRSEDSGAIAPAIMLTTNVTQGKYSLGDRQPSTQLPASPASVIDILNSTTLETDYVDGTNHSELIYPEVPSISSSGGSSSTSSSTTKSPTKQDQSEQHCVVMGVTYPVGAVLKQETGNCLQCVCVAGPENDPAPRVTCTPLNCPPLILPDILDGAGF
uniref:VWFC domain-containing protein n=1 Tax=Anopheles minimus TaxID=112268 RepID=A0A182WBD5_9DIPT